MLVRGFLPVHCFLKIVYDVIQCGLCVVCQVCVVYTTCAAKACGVASQAGH